MYSSSTHEGQAHVCTRPRPSVHRDDDDESSWTRGPVPVYPPAFPAPHNCGHECPRPSSMLSVPELITSSAAPDHSVALAQHPVRLAWLSLLFSLCSQLRVHFRLQSQAPQYSPSSLSQHLENKVSMP